ncbi:MAG TPA: hypothetical protein VLB82_07045 [Thermodesulfobacteriota bacterium]|nr:hypothetical protein [Thermodesulfobacteriota bacterium]
MATIPIAPRTILAKMIPHCPIVETITVGSGSGAGTSPRHGFGSHVSPTPINMESPSQPCASMNSHTSPPSIQGSPRACSGIIHGSKPQSL